MRKLKLIVGVQETKDTVLAPGTIHPPGSVLDEAAIADAAELVRRGFASWVGDKAEGTDLPLARIVAAIAKLDPANPAHFTKSGRPEVKALSDLIGAEVSSRQRDEAWASLQA